MFIDIHCHIEVYGDKINEVVERAKKAGVGIMINSGTDAKTNREALRFARKFDEVKCSLGIYPIHALAMTDKQVNDEIEFIKENQNEIVAIGEVGIDLKESEEYEKQSKNFKKFIELAIKLDKPIIVHSRKAEEECVDILEQFNIKKIIMHCFSGNFKLVKKIIEKGWTMSIPTSIKHTEYFQKIAEMAPLTQLLCETDSPFLHPDKLRNNEPAFVVESYKKIAEIKKMKIEDVERQIEKNYRKLFETL